MTLDPWMIAIIEPLVKSLVVIIALLTLFAYLTLMERYVVAKIQSRVGPNRVGRVGPIALLQPIADAVKMIMKEDFIPAQADKIAYILAPAIAVAPRCSRGQSFRSIRR